MVDLLPSAVNASFTNQLTGSPIKDNLYALENNFYAPVHEDASASAKAKIKDLQAQLVKMKADKDVLEITVKHLQTDLDGKSQLVRRQTDELATLRESVLEL